MLQLLGIANQELCRGELTPSDVPGGELCWVVALCDAGDAVRISAKPPPVCDNNTTKTETLATSAVCDIIPEHGRQQQTFTFSHVNSEAGHFDEQGVLYYLGCSEPSERTQQRQASPIERALSRAPGYVNPHTAGASHDTR